MRRWCDVVCQAVARESQSVDGMNDIVGIQACVRVVRVILVIGKSNRLGNPVGEIEPVAAVESKVFPPPLLIVQSVVRFDETPCTPNKVQPHQVSPIIRVLALLKCGEGIYGALMTPDKFGFSQFPKVAFRSNAEIQVGGNEKLKLRRQINVRLIVRGRRKQNAFARILVDILLDGAESLALSISEVV